MISKNKANNNKKRTIEVSSAKLDRCFVNYIKFNYGLKKQITHNREGRIQVRGHEGLLNKVKYLILEL